MTSRRDPYALVDENERSPVSGWVQIRIDAGDDIDETPDERASPFVHACMAAGTDNAQCVGDLCVTTPFNANQLFTILVIAIDARSVRVVALMVEHRRTVVMLTRSMLGTLLVRAVHVDSVTIATLLIDVGADAREGLAAARELAAIAATEGSESPRITELENVLEERVALEGGAPPPADQQQLTFDYAMGNPPKGGGGSLPSMSEALTKLKLFRTRAAFANKKYAAALAQTKTPGSRLVVIADERDDIEDMADSIFLTFGAQTPPPPTKWYLGDAQATYQLRDLTKKLEVRKSDIGADDIDARLFERVNPAELAKKREKRRISHQIAVHIITYVDDRKGIFSIARYADTGKVLSEKRLRVYEVVETVDGYIFIIDKKSANKKSPLYALSKQDAESWRSAPPLSLGVGGAEPPAELPVEISGVRAVDTDVAYGRVMKALDDYLNAHPEIVARTQVPRDAILAAANVSGKERTSARSSLNNVLIGDIKWQSWRRLLEGPQRVEHILQLFAADNLSEIVGPDMFKVFKLALEEKYDDFGTAMVPLILNSDRRGSSLFSEYADFAIRHNAPRTLTAIYNMLESFNDPLDVFRTNTIVEVLFDSRMRPFDERLLVLNVLLSRFPAQRFLDDNEMLIALAQYTNLDTLKKIVPSERGGDASYNARIGRALMIGLRWNRDEVRSVEMFKYLVDEHVISVATMNSFLGLARNKNKKAFSPQLIDAMIAAGFRDTSGYMTKDAVYSSDWETARRIVAVHADQKMVSQILYEQLNEIRRLDALRGIWSVFTAQLDRAFHLSSEAQTLILELAIKFGDVDLLTDILQRLDLDNVDVHRLEYEIVAGAYTKDSISVLYTRRVLLTLVFGASVNALDVVLLQRVFDANLLDRTNTEHLDKMVEDAVRYRNALSANAESLDTFLIAFMQRTQVKPGEYLTLTILRHNLKKSIAHLVSSHYYSVDELLKTARVSAPAALDTLMALGAPVDETMIALYAHERHNTKEWARLLERLDINTIRSSYSALSDVENMLSILLEKTPLSNETSAQRLQWLHMRVKVLNELTHLTMKTIDVESRGGGGGAAKRERGGGDSSSTEDDDDDVVVLQKRQKSVAQRLSAARRELDDALALAPQKSGVSLSGRLNAGEYLEYARDKSAPVWAKMTRGLPEVPDSAVAFARGLMYEQIDALKALGTKKSVTLLIVARREQEHTERYILTGDYNVLALAKANTARLIPSALYTGELKNAGPYDVSRLRSKRATDGLALTAKQLQLNELVVERTREPIQLSNGHAEFLRVVRVLGNFSPNVTSASSPQSAAGGVGGAGAPQIVTTLTAGEVSANTSKMLFANYVFELERAVKSDDFARSHTLWTEAAERMRATLKLALNALAPVATEKKSSKARERLAQDLVRFDNTLALLSHIVEVSGGRADQKARAAILNVRAHFVNLNKHLAALFSLLQTSFDIRGGDLAAAQYMDIVALVARGVPLKKNTLLRLSEETQRKDVERVSADLARFYDAVTVRLHKKKFSASVIKSQALRDEKAAGKTAMALRIHFNYEADLAGGYEHQYASEIAPSLHVFATHELGVLSYQSADDGVLVVSPQALAEQVVAVTAANNAATAADKSAAMRVLTIDVPFNPAAAQHAKLSEHNLWALPGARSRTDYTVPDDKGRWVLPADASISFNAYAETATQNGQLCRTRAGEALLLLSELFETTPSTADNVRAEWQITGDEPLVKGFVDVHYVELMLHSGDNETVLEDASKHIVFAGKSDAATVFHAEDRDSEARALAAQSTKELWDSVNKSLSVFFPQRVAPLGTSVPSSLRRMHCPNFNTTAGLLPGSVYALRLPRALPPASYYQKALDVALLRNDARAEHLMAAVSAQARTPERTLASSRYVSKILVEMMTVYANAMVYLDDFTNDGGRTYLAEVDSGASPDASTRSNAHRVRLVRRSAGGNRKNTVEISEDYKTARLGHGDDCEGVAKEIYIQYWQFRRAELAQSATSASPLLAHLQQMVRNNVYTPVMVLAAVTNKKLDTSVHVLTDEEAMAHTYTTFVTTSSLLSRLQDADHADAEFAGLSERIRSSAYAKGYKHAPWHDGLDSSLVAEGTARSSTFLLPVATYYDEDDERRREAEKRAVERYNAQVKLMRALPSAVVALEIPNRHIVDDARDIVEDRTDASDFYKANSALYVSAFRDTGILDLAFAQTSGSSSLTHGVRFNRFATRDWHPSLRFVPYNALNERQGALIDAALAQLEPIPALRRDETVATEFESQPPPASLAALSRLFGGGDATTPKTGESTESLLADPEHMPLPPRSIVLTVRAEDYTDEVGASILAAVSKTKEEFSAAHVHTHYLSDVPVRGDESALPPVVLYDIELRLAPSAAAE